MKPPFSLFIRFYQNTQHSTCFRQQSLTLMVTGARWRWWLRFLLATFMSSLPPPLNSQDSDMGFLSPTTQSMDRFGCCFLPWYCFSWQSNMTMLSCQHSSKLNRNMLFRFSSNFSSYFSPFNCCLSFCSLTKGITLKICRLCVCVLINRCSFESFMCLDLNWFFEWHCRLQSLMWTRMAS